MTAEKIVGYLTLTLFFLACAALAVMATQAFGRDLDGRYAQVSPEIRQWFNNLLNKKKYNCCAFADGYRVDDPDWEITGDPNVPYRVFVQGSWLDVPEEAVVDSTNKVGYPIVWPYQLEGKTWVRCFLPGTGA